MDLDLSKVTKAYLNIRDAKSALKAEWAKKDAELNEALEKLENVMLGHLNAMGAQSVRTDSATFYRQETLKPSASDWNAVNDFVKQNDAFDLYERRLKKDFVKQYMDEHEGSPPPGVSVFREFEVRVRRGD